MQPLFTPAPWRLDDPIHGTVRADYHCIDAGRGYLVAGGNGFGIAGFMTIHDARLIRAAPDMFEALQDALEFIDDQADVRDGSDGQQLPNRAMALAGELRAAISKALGGSHVGS
jgi:hypothetical protein